MQDRNQGRTFGLYRATLRGTAGFAAPFVAGMALFVLLAAASAAVGWYYFLAPPPIVKLRVAAGPYRSDSFEMMREIADVVARHSDRIRIEVVAARDSSRNIAHLNEREVELATIRSDTPAIADVRIVAGLFPDYFQLIARGGAFIAGIADLEGKRIAIPRHGTDEFRSFWIIGDHYDLSLTKVAWRAMTAEDAIVALIGNEVDAIFTVRSLRDRLLIGLFEDAQLKSLPLDLIEIDQAQAIAVKRPFLSAGAIPRGALSGYGPAPSRNIQTATVNRILVSRSDVDEAAIAELTRILFEHRLDLTVRFPLASAISRPDLSQGLSVPLHAGAARFYDRDEPGFLRRNSEPIALLLTLAAMAGSGLIALRARLLRGQKNRMDQYNYALLDIAGQARAADNAAKIATLRSELFATLEKVVRALDTDEVTGEGFQSFSLLHEAVRRILDARRAELGVVRNKGRRVR
jgi:TRAP transporter TAXI family solute receptor